MGSELLKREQGLIREQSDNPALWESCGEPVHDVDVHITIPVKGPDLEKVFQAEKLLFEAGVVFDTGYGDGCRDWEFDWSLRGAYVKKRRDLTPIEQEANWLKRILGPAKQETHLPCQVLADPNDPHHFTVIIYGRKEVFGELAAKRIIHAGGEPYYATPEPEAGQPPPELGPFVGYKIRKTNIRVKVAYTESEEGY